MTRLKSLYVKDLRSIDGEVTVSLDAPIVLIHGPNGAGKTSLLSAIELALTGAVPSLWRAEPDYLAYLPHKDRPFGEVRLEVSEADGTVRTSTIKVTTGGVTGTPILAGAEASFFSERSYLAQSTLGRLLEIYQHAEKKSDSPLTRFVKERLGLDRMEAVIGGLHSAGNIARLKGPVPAYGTVRDDISMMDKALKNLKQQEHEVANSIAALDGQLRESLATIDPALADRITDLSELSRLLASDPEESALVEHVRTRREVEVSWASWTQANDADETPERASIEARNRTARAAFEEWMRLNGVNIETLLARAGALFADLSVSRESGYGDRAHSLVVRVQADLDRVQHLMSAHEKALQHRDGLTREIEEARTRVGRLDEQITMAADASESLARTLSALSTHIHGDICPVCDRDYSETGSTLLAAHVAVKVSAMVEQAGRLQSLAKDRSATSAAVAQLDRQRAAATAELLGDAELNHLKIRGADLTEVAGQLINGAPLMQEGDRLRDNASRAARSTLDLQNANRLVVALRDSLENLGRRVGIEAGDDMPTAVLVERLKSAIEGREETLTRCQRARRSAVEAVASLGALNRERSNLQAEQREAEAALATMRRQKADADQLIDLAKDLVRQTREARGRVVRRVFNDELNAVWRDLFVRLAPEEPFIPAFAIPDVAGADIEAILETHHRRGGTGGNPRAMLSAGNLNTAALTLFLALHLSVKAKLSWLVIDDPVQSMDEVHIAQFAALLRTLSKQMNRQVIIAVHERSLFDYLTLELSPAFEGDRLNIIELGRNAIGQTTSRWEPKLFVADRAIAA
ncbi:MAG: AAA family ATPase [Aliidongia sp.]